jgi:hypothetical protein
VFLDGDSLRHVSTEAQHEDAWWPLLDRVKAAASREPVATPGQHCAQCYSRHHCPTWRALTATAVAVLGTPSTDIALTDETAAQMAVRRDAVAKALDIVDDLLKAHVRSGGTIESGGRSWGPSQRAGRSSVDVDALKASGVEVPMKQGAPYDVWSWKKARP